MRLIRHDLMPTIVLVIVAAGLMGLAFHSFVHAEEDPANTTRGKAVYQRHCQGLSGLPWCRRLGGWTGGAGPQGGPG